MSNTRIGAIFGASLHDNNTQYARLRMIFVYPNLHTIFQFVHFNF